ncbi:helix-turn-helix domain-containing protein [Lacticaseibacillus saniviri]|uniref:helix-turn-helix domain-containing protein n=1 Tax=Lacticaseibacillus saniviri TaxID=931533 RepID=UPI0009E7B5CB|nr:helix-turn-helix transcriptional regulator [Lacticaseibacillus saniviri]MCG4282943.1 helix-turn-helix domain-containing protein [Lacticaseibacillus saniviri]
MNLDFFGVRLKSARKLKHLTQLELSQRLDVNKGIISDYEQGLSYPPLETFSRICSVLDASADYLLGIADSLSFKFGELTEERAESILRFVSLIEDANRILDKS